MKKCVDCAREHPREYSFCPICGKPIAEHCSGCGKVLPANAVYCPYCGKKQETADTSAPSAVTAAPADSGKGNVHGISIGCVPMTEAEKEFFTSMTWRKPDRTQDYLVWDWSETITGWSALDDGDTYDAGEEYKTLYVAKLTADQQERFRQENRNRFLKYAFSDSDVFGEFNQASKYFVKKSVWDKWKSNRYSSYIIENDPEGKTAGHTCFAVAENVIEQGDFYLIACSHWKWELPDRNLINIKAE